MNRAHRTLEVYNFLRESPVAGHLFVWVGGTKGTSPEDKEALRWTSDSGNSSWLGFESVRARARSQCGGALAVGHHGEPERHTSIQDPPPGPPLSPQVSRKEGVKQRIRKGRAFREAVRSSVSDS
ncbi:unnamed protein product [Pleuronectes platessa]|uniref:Uncharacterized protein n=1 Tax=Pleuronectes platessa TaxID=8262 RepID=A0A9N7V3V9_PLEPL|nr:unnamed protein product [Pleuronectes platessa]